MAFELLFLYSPTSLRCSTGRETSRRPGNFDRVVIFKKSARAKPFRIYKITRYRTCRLSGSTICVNLALGDMAPWLCVLDRGCYKSGELPES